MTRREFGIAVSGASALVGCGTSEVASQPAPEPVPAISRAENLHRGVNFTAEWPDKYDSDRARRIIRQLPEFGVDSIALVPYGSCRLGSPDIRFSGRRSWERDASIQGLSELVHESGMRLLLKPQIWVPRSFPGDLDYSSDADRRTWFDGYEKFLTHYAKLAAAIQADLFCVGVEFSKLIKYEAEWRRLIAHTHDHYSGKLVYAANWGHEFESVNFWDALDFIGLNNYYPLPDSLDAGKVVEKIGEVYSKFQKPIIFPEAGFPSLTAPHHEPWAEEPRDISLEDQARCYEAAFAAYWDKPWFHGVYWWKVGSNGMGGAKDASHSPWNKPAMDIIAKWYLRDGQG
jgi:glycosyl hydrolase family 113